MRLLFAYRRVLLLPALLAAVLAGASRELIGLCGPFTDVAEDAFCPFVLEIFYLGITTGTTATTYDPAGNVTRLQMAAFLSRTVDGVLKRGRRRAALNRFWSTRNDAAIDVTTVGLFSKLPASDGTDVWVPSQNDGTVARVHASDGALLGTWTGGLFPDAALSAMGKIFIAADTAPSRLHRIDPREPAGAMTTVATTSGNFALSIAFDGWRIWMPESFGSVSIVTPSASLPWTATTITAGFTTPVGILFDGSSMWVTDQGPATLLKLDLNGTVLQTVTVGSGVEHPAFDGANIWVPNTNSGTVSVVRASNGAVLATLTGNGLSGPYMAAFDGERILVTNQLGPSVSLFKAADLTPISSVSTGTASLPQGVCSDGLDFWIVIHNNQLARF